MRLHIQMWLLLLRSCLTNPNAGTQTLGSSGGRMMGGSAWFSEENYSIVSKGMMSNPLGVNCSVIFHDFNAVLQKKKEKSR